MKTKLIKFHFIILLILVVNFFIGLVLNFELNNYVKIGLKILFYGSALVGFFICFKPFRLVTAYFSLYLFFPFAFLAVLGKNGFMVAAFLLPLTNSFPLYENNNFQIYNHFAIMGACCEYEVYENYSPFIRYRGSFIYTEIIDKEPVNFSDSTIEMIKNVEIEKDNVFIEFKDKATRRFKLY